MKMINKICDWCLFLGSIVLTVQYTQILFGGTNYESPTLLGIALVFLKLYMMEDKL